MVTFCRAPLCRVCAAERQPMPRNIADADVSRRCRRRYADFDAASYQPRYCYRRCRACLISRRFAASPRLRATPPRLILRYGAVAAAARYRTAQPRLRQSRRQARPRRWHDALPAATQRSATSVMRESAPLLTRHVTCLASSIP